MLQDLFEMVNEDYDRTQYGPQLYYKIKARVATSGSPVTKTYFVKQMSPKSYLEVDKHGNTLHDAGSGKTEKRMLILSAEDIISKEPARVSKQYGELAVTNESAEDIEDLIKIMRNDPYTPTDPYMQGLANGLIVAKACALDQEEMDPLIDHEHSDRCDCEDKDVEEAIVEGNYYLLGLEFDLAEVNRAVRLKRDKDSADYYHADVNGRKWIIRRAYDNNDNRVGWDVFDVTSGKDVGDDTWVDRYSQLQAAKCMIYHWSKNKAANESLQEGWKDKLTATALAGSLIASPVQATAKTAIDAGHGGRDPGAVVGQTYEKNINMAYAKALQDMLPGSVATREGDVYVSIGQRVRDGNASDSDAFISFHANSTDDQVTSASGVRVLFWHSSTRGQALAKGLVDALGGKAVPINAGDRGAGLLSGTKMPAVIIELGFMNNPEDLKKIQSTEHREVVVRAVASVLHEMGYEKEISKESKSLSSIFRGTSVANTADFSRLVECVAEDFKSSLNEASSAWEITIPGLTTNLPKQYAFTHASSEGEAMRNVISKIAEEFGSRGWMFKDNRFSATIAPRNIGTIIKHLNLNHNLWTARKIEDKQ